jgi:hypothetical protein
MSYTIPQPLDFYRLLLHIDQELANEVRSRGCACGGVLHRANYPRKPRGCPREMRADFSTRFSFCCNRCRRRTTSMSVRFLGRRVYLDLVVVLASTRTANQAISASLSLELGVPVCTLKRWHQWWTEQFPLTTVWQAQCARFIPSVVDLFPASLLNRFETLAANTHDALQKLLSFLTPLTVGIVTLNEGR